ncbi:MAG: DUF4082 domain-containing protein [Ignavibacteriaceae bacterium]|nr:DUF4082 domain-containing protein [Ignavibacteriaceae bacterium]
MKTGSRVFIKTKLFVLALLLFLSVSGFSQTNIFTNQVPVNSGNDSDYELGLKFTSLTETEITSIRFYKMPGETGTHTGSLWTSTGTLLASVNFTNETQEGWQNAILSSPVVISPNTVYVVSVNINTVYAIEQNALASPVTNGVLSTVADGNNGVFNVTTGQFPQSSWNNSNYFVDITGTPLNSIFTTQTPVGEFNDGPYELGVKFTVSQVSKLRFIKYYRMGGESGTHTGHLWDENGDLLATAAFTDETATGWQNAELTQDVFLSPGITYIASVNSNFTYAASAQQALQNPVINGVLSTVADNANGVYGTPGLFPVSSYNNTNYFRDVTVEPLYTPAAPVLSAPAGNASNCSIEPEFSWNYDPVARYYTFQISDTPDFSNLVISASGFTANNYRVTGLDNSKVYYWRVKAHNHALQSGYSSASFTTTAFVQMVQSWPVGGVYVYTATPTFSWYLPMGGTGWKYDLLYDTDPAFSNPGVLSDLTTNTVTHPGGLLPGTVYYWKVRLKFSSGGVVCYSGSSSFRSFGIPVVPVASYPSGGALLYTNVATLYWYLNDPGLNLTYDVEVVEGPPGNLTGTANYTGISSMSLPGVSLTQGTQYSWAVKSKSGSSYSEWSAPATFSTVSVPSVIIPTPSWPVGSAVVYTASPTLHWYLGASATGLSYQVEFVEGAGTPFTEIPDITGITNLSVTLTELTPGSVYKWKVRSTDGISFSDWSDEAIFSVTGSLTPVPLVPTPSWPVGGAAVYSSTASLNWWLGAVIPGITYEVEYGTGALTGTPTVSGLTSTSLEVDNLLPGTVYYWRVKSRLGLQTSGWSATQTFTTVSSTASVSTPVPSWPVGGATVYSENPTLYWFLNSSSVGLTYKLDYATAANFSDIITVDGLTESSYELTGLTPGVTYYWRVKSFDGTVYSAPSATAVFVVAAGDAPVTPVTGSPVNGVIVNTTAPVLSWFIPTQANITEYTVQYSTNPDMSGATTLQSSGASITVNGLNPGLTYYWRVNSTNQSGNTSAFSDIQEFNPGSPTGIKDGVVPSQYNLKQNFPNPFNPSTVIEFSVITDGNYKLEIYNSIGEIVSVLLDNHIEKGVHSIQFNASSLGNGVYFYRLSGENVNIVKKMVLLK